MFLVPGPEHTMSVVSVEVKTIPLEMHSVDSLLHRHGIHIGFLSVEKNRNICEPKGPMDVSAHAKYPVV